jgi:hypothetical protein
VNRRPPRGKKVQHYVAQTDTPDPMVNQDQQVQMMLDRHQNQVQYPMFTTEDQFQNPNLQNEQAQYHHMIPSHSMEHPSIYQVSLSMTRSASRKYN